MNTMRKFLLRLDRYKRQSKHTRQYHLFDQVNHSPSSWILSEILSAIMSGRTAIIILITHNHIIKNIAFRRIRELLPNREEHDVSISRTRRSMIIDQVLIIGITRSTNVLEDLRGYGTNIDHAIGWDVSESEMETTLHEIERVGSVVRQGQGFYYNRDNPEDNTRRRYTVSSGT